MINIHVNHESTKHQSPREGLQHDRQIFLDGHITRLSKAVFLLLHKKKTLCFPHQIVWLALKRAGCYC